MLLTGGDSGEAESSGKGAVPLREQRLEWQPGGQVPAPRAAGAPTERPHLPELRRNLTRTQQRDGSGKSRMTRSKLSLETESHVVMFNF